EAEREPDQVRELHGGGVDSLRVPDARSAIRDPAKQLDRMRKRGPLGRVFLLPWVPGRRAGCAGACPGHQACHFAIAGARASEGKTFSIFGSTLFFFISSSQMRWMRGS